MENELLIDEQLTNNIVYRAYLPIHRENVSELHTEKDGRKFRYVEGAIVVDRRVIQKQMNWTDDEASDHFKTLWGVEGFLTDARKINYDFRHHGISTGAVGERSWVVDDYEIQIDDKILKVPARMLSVKVYEDSMIRFKGRNGETIEDGNLLENIENGRVFTWSVQFHPVTQSRTRSGLKIFTSYHTPKISFLDETQGIPDAGGFTLRNYLQTDIFNKSHSQINSVLSFLRKLTSNNQPMSMYKKGDELSRQVKAKINSDPTEKEGKFTYRVMIDDAEESEMDENELERMFGKIPVKDSDEVPKPEDKDKNKRAESENSQIRSLEIAVESLQALVKGLASKVDSQTRSEPEPKTNTETPQPKTNPDPKSSAEDKDEELAQRYLDSSVLSSLVAKNPTLLNQIEDGEVKERLTRSLSVKTPKANPSKEPAAQFENGEVSQKRNGREVAQKIIQNSNPYTY